ncbi:MAG: PAS domain S-box protein [Candidatus Nanopelagicales bacterium]
MAEDMPLDPSPHPLSSEQVRSLLAAASDVVLELNPDMTLAWASPSVRDFLGWDPQALVGESLRSLVHQDDDVPVDAPAAPFRFRAADDSHRWLSGAIREVRERGRSLGRILGLRDIDDKIRARQELQESEARYRLLVENTSDVVVVSDNHGVPQWISESVQGVLGWPAEDLIGRSFREFIHPDDLPLVAEAHKRLNAGEPARMVVRMHTASGVDRRLNALVRPLLDEEGTVVGRVAGWRDVEMEFEAEEALRSSRAEFQLIAENAEDVVVLLRPSGQVLWVSPSVTRLAGWQPERVLGGGWRDLIHPDDAQELAEFLRTVVDGQMRAAAEARCLTADGTYIHGLITVRRPAEDPQANLVATVRNIDAEVRARQEAETQSARRLALLNSTFDPHVLLQAIRDESGAIVDFEYVDANAAACAYNQTTREELVGRRLLELLPAHRGTGLFAQYCHTVDTGEPLILDDFVCPHEVMAETRRFDIRAVKADDALSYTWRDVTDRALAAQRLAASEARFRLLAENVADVVALTRDDAFQWVSPSLIRTLGWNPSEWHDRHYTDFVHPDDGDAMRGWLLELTSGEAPVHRARLRHGDGTYRWVELRASLVPGDGDGPQEVVSTFRTIDDVIAREQALIRQATLDDLTGALKRDEALRRLTRLTQQRRQPGPESAIVFCDVDHFKRINDTRGHMVGDAVLREVAQRVRAAVRQTDLLARMGGDEFLLVLDGVHSYDEATVLGEKIRHQFDRPIEVNGLAVPVTLSVGVTLLRGDEDADRVIARADQAMYRAKESGRNTVVVVE